MYKAQMKQALLLCLVIIFVEDIGLANQTDESDSPTIAGCPMFPADNIWNTPIDTLPVDEHSDDYIDAIGSDVGLHPDFGSGLWDGGPIGIPYTIVSGDQSAADISFYYPDESDPGPYPIPPDALIEGGSDGE